MPSFPNVRSLILKGVAIIEFPGPQNNVRFVIFALILTANL